MVNFRSSSIFSELNLASSTLGLSENIIWLVLIILFFASFLIYFSNRDKVKISQNFTEEVINLQNKIQEETTEITTIAQDKINSALNEYKRLLPYLEELGLKVEGFNIEAGLLPKIETSLRGSLENIKNETIERIKEENKTNSLLIATLNAILMAKRCHEQLESIYISIFKDIIINITLGIPPSISIRFQ